MKKGGSGKILRWSMLSMGPKTICASDSILKTKVLNQELAP
jgi:hypothetical protein